MITITVLFLYVKEERRGPLRVKTSVVYFDQRTHDFVWACMGKIPWKIEFLLFFSVFTLWTLSNLIKKTEKNTNFQPLYQCLGLTPKSWYKYFEGGFFKKHNFYHNMQQTSRACVIKITYIIYTQFFCKLFSCDNFFP